MTDFLFETATEISATAAGLDAERPAAVPGEEVPTLDGGVPCFTIGCTVATASGTKAVEDVMPGDRLLTRDNGFQPVVWAGRRRLGKHKLRSDPDLLPVRIAKDSLGEGVPNRDILVSPYHRLLRNRRASGGGETLASALSQTPVAGIQRMQVETVTYVHLLFERHEVILSDGLWSESFLPDSETIARMTGPQRGSLLDLFPMLAEAGRAAFAAARPIYA